MCLQSTKGTHTKSLGAAGSTTIGPFGPAEPHQNYMSHANKLVALTYSQRAHSEWALLNRLDAQEEAHAVQLRREQLAKARVRITLRIDKGLGCIGNH